MTTTTLIGQQPRIPRAKSGTEHSYACQNACQNLTVAVLKIDNEPHSVADRHFWVIVFSCTLIQRPSHHHSPQSSILGLHYHWWAKTKLNPTVRSRDGAVVRALTSHQCGQGSIPCVGVIRGLSLLVLYSAPRGFSPGTPVSRSPKKPTFDFTCVNC